MPTYARYSGVGGGGIQSINNSTIPAQQIVAGAGISVGTVVGTGITTITNTSPMAATGNLTEATSSVLTISGGTGCVIGSGTTIQVLQSSAIQSGYLSSTDWSTFNGAAGIVANATNVATPSTLALRDAGANCDFAQVNAATFSSTDLTTGLASLDYVNYLQLTDLSGGSTTNLIPAILTLTSALGPFVITADANNPSITVAGTAGINALIQPLSVEVNDTAGNIGTLSNTSLSIVNAAGSSGSVAPNSLSVLDISGPFVSTITGGQISLTVSAGNGLNVTCQSADLTTLTGNSTSSNPYVFNVVSGNGIGAVVKSNNITLKGTTAGELSVSVPASVTSYSVIMPGAQGATNSVLANDGSGNLSWSTGFANTALSNLANPTAINQSLLFGTDNTFDIGAAGASRPRDIYVGTSVITPLVQARDNVVGSGQHDITVRAGNGVTGNKDGGVLTLAGGVKSGTGIDGYIVLRTDSAERMRILGTGNVGIGTTTPSQLLEVSGNAKVNSALLTGSTSGTITLSAADTTTSYAVKMPAAQGVASSVLQNDGSGNLSWAVSVLPTQTGNSGKFLVTDGTNASWDSVVNEAGLSTVDFRVEGDTDVNLLFTDASADNVGIGTNAPGAKLDVRGSVIINEAAGNNDVRIEGQSDANLLFTDASADRVGIGNNAPTAKLDVTGNIIASTDIQSASQNSGQLAGTRNRIINGAMQIDQRNAGASVTITSVVQQYTLDRWDATEDSDATITVQQVTDAPTGFPFSLKVTVTTADASIGATQYAIVRQPIEGFNTSDLSFGTANALTVTVSFWVKSSVTGTFGGVLQNSAFDRSYAFQYTINSANTWEKKSVSIAGDTTGTWIGATNGAGIRVGFSLGAGTTYSGTANTWTGSYIQQATGNVNLISTLNATWQLTGVQLEIGTVATPFEWRNFQQELALCQRYYEKSFDLGTKPAQNAGSNGASIAAQAGGASTALAMPSVTFAVKKRAAPGIVTTYNPSAANSQIRNFTLGSDYASTTVTDIGDRSMMIFGTSQVGSATGNTIAIHWVAESEI